MMNIPPGFRFKPSDEELISDYLVKKAANEPLPSDVIGVRDLYGLESPWQVFNDSDPWITESDDATKKCIYVFTCRKPVSKGGSRKIRKAGCGTWNGETGTKKIFDKVTGKQIGERRMFVFISHDENMKNIKCPHWIMHEFSLAGSSLDAIKGRSDHKYVVCRIRRDESKNLWVKPQSQDNKKKTLNEETRKSEYNGQGEPTHISITSSLDQINGDKVDEDENMSETRTLLDQEHPNSGEQRQQPVEAQVLSIPQQRTYAHDGFQVVECPLADFGDYMMPTSVGNQMPIQIEQHLHLDGDIEVPKEQESEIVMPLPVSDQVPEQLPYNADDDYLEFFLGCSFTDLEDPPAWMCGLAVPEGPLFLDGFESIYIPQEIQQYDTACQPIWKRVRDIDQEDNEEQKNNKKIRQDEDVADS